MVVNLKAKKRLAARVTGVGIHRIRFDTAHLDDIADAITRDDIRSLITANTITIKQDSKGEIEFTDAVGTPKSVGIGTTVSVNTSGIITASSFVGGFISCLWIAHRLVRRECVSQSRAENAILLKLCLKTSSIL